MPFMYSYYVGQFLPISFVNLDIHTVCLFLRNRDFEHIKTPYLSAKRTIYSE